MRLLFVHDHRFYRGDSGAILTSGSLPADIWERYLEHFDELRVVGRDGGSSPAGANYAVSSRSRVGFDLVPDAGYARLLLQPGAFQQRLRKAVAECDAAIVRLPSELGFIAAAECRRAGKPYAVEMVGCAWDAMRNHGSWSAWLYAPLFYRRTRRALRLAPMTLYVTSAWLQQRYPTMGKAYAASDVEIAPLSDEQLQARRARLAAIADGRPPELGTIASLRIRSKGIQTAISALSSLRNEGVELTYRVLGGGDSAPWLALAEQHGVADLVSFDGMRPAGEGVREWLDTIDIHLQPSFQEGLPRASVEAMSRGAACIGSTCGGIPELIPHERLHRPGDVAGLAQQIRELATNPGAVAQASEQDLKTAQAFLPDRLQALRSEFLADLAEATKRAR